MGDEESVKLLLENGADPRKCGSCAMTPLDIATIEEHEAVVQLLLVAGTGQHSNVEYVEDEGAGSNAKVETSNPRLGNALVDEPEFPSEVSDNAQPAQSTDGRSETPQSQDSHTERPIYIQLEDTSRDVDATAQQRPESSTPDPTFSNPPTSQILQFVVEFINGRVLVFDVLSILSKAKTEAKTNGDKSSGSSPTLARASCGIRL